MIVNNYTPVTEAYFGKTKNLIAVERLIEGIIQRFTVPFKDIGKRRIDAVKVNKSKENRQIEALLCKEFGFKEMVLHWDGSDTVNAFTVTHGLLKLSDGSEPILPIRNSDGTYYDSKHAYICVVNMYGGMIDIKLNAEEIVACLLHEIGHNFVCTPIVNIVSVTEWVMLPVNIYCSILESRKLLDSIKDLDGLAKNDALKQHKNIMAKIASSKFVQLILSILRVYDFWDFIKLGIYRVFYNYIMPDAVKDMFEDMDKWILDNKNTIKAEWDVYVKEVEKAKEFYKKNPDYVLWTKPLGTLVDLFNIFFMGNILIVQSLLSNQSGYSNEVFADSFATAYGYGSATVSLQRKLSYYSLNNKALAKQNKYNVYNQYIMIMTRLMITFLDEHPMSQNRMKQQIDKLKSDLNDPNVDPRIRGQLIRDIERSEKIYNEYLTKLPPELKHMAVIMNFIQFNERYFGGKLDLREPINRIFNFGNATA